MSTAPLRQYAAKFSWLLLLLFLCECTKKSADLDNTYYTHVKQNIRSLDPVLASDLYSQQAQAQIYESLLHFHYLKRPIQLEPQLAEAMPDISPDGLTYTFKIKKGILFHDSSAFSGGKGRELTAQDFIYSWKRLADPKNKSESYWVFENKVAGLDEWRKAAGRGKADYDKEIEGFQAPDSHTLVIKLLKPNYQLLYVLASSMTAAVPREAVQHFAEDFPNKAVGTGAFRLANWARGSRLELERNPSYRKESYPAEGETNDRAAGLLRDAGERLPLVDRIVIQEISEEQPQWLSFQKGDLDVSVLSKDYIEKAVKDNKLLPEFTNKKMSLQTVSSQDVTYISFNTENKFLKNKKLRQAMSVAFDKDTLIKTLFGGMAVAAHGPIPPSLDGYRPQVNYPYAKYDLEKAKQLLAEAGFPQGRGLPVFTYEMAATHATARQFAEFFKQHMGRIGIKIKLSGNSWAQFSDKVRNKKADIFEMAWNADYPDADNFFQLFYSKNISPGPNNSNFRDGTFDALFEQAGKLGPGAERTALYQKMEELLADEAPWIFSVHRLRVVLTHAWLSNYKHEYVILDSMKYYRVDDELRKNLKKKF